MIHHFADVLYCYYCQGLRTDCCCAPLTDSPRRELFSEWSCCIVMLLTWVCAAVTAWVGETNEYFLDQFVIKKTFLSFCGTKRFFFFSASLWRWNIFGNALRKTFWIFKVLRDARGVQTVQLGRLEVLFLHYVEVKMYSFFVENEHSQTPTSAFRSQPFFVAWYKTRLNNLHRCHCTLQFLFFLNNIFPDTEMHFSFPEAHLPTFSTLVAFFKDGHLWGGIIPLLSCTYPAKLSLDLAVFHVSLMATDVSSPAH